MSQTTKKEKKEYNVTMPTDKLPAMIEGETEQDQMNLSPAEFKFVLRQLAKDYKQLVGMARKIGEKPDGIELDDGTHFGAKELNALVSRQNKALKNLGKNYQAHGKKKKRAQTGEPRKGDGFAKGSFLRPELVEFLRNANFGNDSEGRPLKETLEPLLKQSMLSRAILTPLLTIYMFVNGHRFMEGGKVYFRAGPEMVKYLGAYLTALEQGDKNLSDDERRSSNGQVKPRFDRNKFVYNRLQSIVNPGIIPARDLDQQHLDYVERPEVKTALAKAQGIVSQAKVQANPKKEKTPGQKPGRKKAPAKTKTTRSRSPSPRK